MSKKKIIYGLICPECRQIRYIGQTISKSAQSRLSDHIREAFYCKNSYTHKENWIRKVHTVNNPITVIVIDTAETNEELNEKEIRWISIFPNLTNSSNGGTSGYVFTDEVKSKISASRIGPKNPNFGNHTSPTTYQKQQRSNGMKMSVKFQKYKAFTLGVFWMKILLLLRNFQMLEK